MSPQYLPGQPMIPYPGETREAFEGRTGQLASAVRVPIAAPPTAQLGPTPMVPTAPPVPIQGTPEVGVAAIPAALAAILPAGLVAGVGAAYGLAQAVGVQFPWETGPGEGFISPFTRDIKQDESGRWVTRETRPDLWNGGAVMAPTVMKAQDFAQLGAYGPTVVKTWTANGWPFAMTSDGRIHTVTKSGIRKSWKPYKSIVLGKTLKVGMAKRAVRKLQSIVQLGKDIEKLGGTRVVYRKKK